MSGPRVSIELQPAFLLHHRPYRDTSRLLELLTRDHGRIGLVARGVRRPGSVLRPVLQSFQPLFVSWSSRGDLGTLTGAEMAMSGARLPPERLNSAYYLNELLIRLTRRHDVNPELFEIYARCLTQLTRNDDQRRALRLFEKRLLEALGYGLELARTLSGDPVRSQCNYEYRSEQGLVVAQHTENETMLFAGDSLQSLAEERLDSEQALRDAKRLLHTALDVYLGPRPLKVRQVSQALRRSRK